MSEKRFMKGNEAIAEAAVRGGCRFFAGYPITPQNEIPNTCPDCYNAEDFTYDHPRGVFVLGFGRHVATVVDGDIYDSWDSSNEIPQYYWYKEI